MIIVGLMYRMEENNNGKEEIMKDDFKEGAQNEKRSGCLKSDVWDRYQSFLEEKRKL